MRLSPVLATLFGIALALGATAGAGDLSAQKKKIARCVKYSQKRGTDNQSVDVGLRNRCGYAVHCSVEWTVTCAGDDKSSRGHARAVDLDRGAAELIHASAARCGDGDWAVDDITWSCEPR